MFKRTNQKSPLSDRYKIYKFRAKSKGLAFDISKQEFDAMTRQTCVYCGKLDQYNGIDRVDNNKGYVPGNMVTCCQLCNVFKKDFTTMEFLSHCKSIVDFQNSQKGGLA